VQAYSDPKRESEPTALPDLEVWKHTTFEGDNPDECPRGTVVGPQEEEYQHEHGPTECDGWYWQACSPGCLPDSEPIGPFATKAEALADARQGTDEEEAR